MLEKPDIPPIPPALERVALTLRTVGWIAFWLQLVLAVVSAVTLLTFAIFSGNSEVERSTQGTGFGVFFAICGLITLGVGIYFAFRYTRISRKLRYAEPTDRPSKAETLRTVRLGLIVNLVGMLFTIVGAQAIVGSILALSLSQPQGGAIFESRRFVQPLDLFAVQANTNSIAAHFVGIVASVWLLNRVNR